MRGCKIKHNVSAHHARQETAQPPLPPSTGSQPTSATVMLSINTLILVDMRASVVWGESWCRVGLWPVRNMPSVGVLPSCIWRDEPGSATDRPIQAHSVLAIESVLLSERLNTVVSAALNICHNVNSFDSHQRAFAKAAIMLRSNFGGEAHGPDR